MEKRKNDDLSSRALAKAPLVALLIGSVALCLFTIGGLYLLFRGLQSEAPPTAAPPTTTPLPSNVTQLTPIPSATSGSFTMPSDALLVVSTTDNDILISSDG